LYRFHALADDPDRKEEVMDTLFDEALVEEEPLVSPQLCAYYDWLIWSTATEGTVDHRHHA
jgi:hypothetical protein